ASRLGMDTSTVSRRLVALEEALGVRLFDRTRQGVLPTRHAEVILPAAEAMEAAQARLTRDVTGVEARAEGVVRLSCAPGVSETFVVPSLVRLRQRHPGLRLELDASVRAVDLTRHEADLALRSVPSRGAELLLTKLVTVRWEVVTSPELARRLGRVERWDVAPWVTWGEDLASIPTARWLTRHVPTADRVLRTSHFTSQLVAAASGLGLVLAPGPYLPRYGLVPVRHARALDASAADLPEEALWLVGHRALRDVPRVAAVWDFLLEEFRERTAPRSRARSGGK
ncbi:MAG: LysR family transcriptional regulator, partial [Myxococcaceae bacterium]|nr:LysR family transcriptional regulator [Myxococcaceae bacterium]